MSRDALDKVRKAPHLMYTPEREMALYSGDKYINQAYTLINDASISLIANTEKGKGVDVGLQVAKLMGTIIHGPISLNAAPEHIRVSSACCINPVALLGMASCLSTPIPTFIPMELFKLEAGSFDSIQSSLNEFVDDDEFVITKDYSE